MKIALLNTVYGVTSVGSLMAKLVSTLKSQGHEVLPIYSRGNVPEKLLEGSFCMGDNLGTRWHGLMTRLLDRHGLCSCGATKKLLRKLDEFQPDLLWLQNLHGYYLNYPMLFRWIKAHPSLEVRWTLHDCWSFTGHCAQFAACGCERWKVGCHHCPQRKTYPISILWDGSRRNYRLKRESFTGVAHLTLQTPSHWLAGMARQSFLRDYPVEVVPNTIDRNIFKPTEGDFRKRYGIGDRKLLLFVTNIWNEKKGLNTVFRFAELPAEEYAVVIVGVDEAIEKRLPKNLIAIRRTQNARELAEIYTAADLFINPTLEDTYPTVNLEALACGTPVLTWEAGGSPEMLDESCGRVVAYRDEEALLAMAIHMVHENPCSREACLRKGLEA